MYVFIRKLHRKNKILNYSQYGFRNHRSTAMAIIYLIEYVTTALDKKKHIIGFFIDLKKRSIQLTMKY